MDPRSAFRADQFRRVMMASQSSSWPARVALTVGLLMAGAVALVLMAIVLVPAAIVFVLLSLFARIARVFSRAPGSETDAGRENVRVIRRDEG